jgi:hypothetical protein
MPTLRHFFAAGALAACTATATATVVIDDFGDAAISGYVNAGLF